MFLDLVVDNDNNPPPKLADLGVKVECTKCLHRWDVGFGDVLGDIKCPECSGKNKESGTG